MAIRLLRRGELLSRDIGDYPDGIVVALDKPYRWTSAEVVRKLKWAAIKHFGKKNLKVGHAGTLDPLATGLLLVCIGPATRQAQTLQDHDKEYIAGVSFGAVTASYDLEKDIVPAGGSLSTPPPQGRGAVEKVLPGFVGEQMQVAPLFSAKSVDGVRAYEMARKLYKAGQAVPDEGIIRASRIRIDKMELLSYGKLSDYIRPDMVSDNRIHVADLKGWEGLPAAEILVGCSKGTYIRAIARDLGEALDTGAFLHSLRRTRIGEISIDDALSLDETLAALSN
ncbi:MAG: tRNA pseudouridine(55) synthase TruB [Bacteroidales bacterium]|nr:tRNA pseudouridine(55) synthase TruB [Bacteroidales bacterium]